MDPFVRHRLNTIVALALVVVGCAGSTGGQQRSAVEIPAEPAHSPIAVDVLHHATAIAAAVAQVEADVVQCSRYRAEFIEFHAFEHVRIQNVRRALGAWRAQKQPCKSMDELEVLRRYARQIASARLGEDLVPDALEVLAELDACRDKIIADQPLFCFELGEDVHSAIWGVYAEARRERIAFDWVVSTQDCPESVEITVLGWTIDELRERTASLAVDLEKYGVSRLTLNDGQSSLTLTLHPAPRQQLRRTWAERWGYVELDIREPTSLFTTTTCPGQP